jgi:integrase
VPLSAPVLGLLDELHPLGKGSEWVFPGADGESHRVAIHKAHNRIRRRSSVSFVPHDLRRTAASHMTSMGISRLVVSKVLNHVESGITAVYDRHSYDAEKRAALDAWGRRVEEILTGGATAPANVVSLRSA